MPVDGLDPYQHAAESCHENGPCASSHARQTPARPLSLLLLLSLPPLNKQAASSKQDTMPSLLASLLTFPLLLTISLPLALLALLTTSLAFTALWLRLLLVYADLLLAFLHTWLALYRPAPPSHPLAITTNIASASSVSSSPSSHRTAKPPTYLPLTSHTATTTTSISTTTRPPTPPPPALLQRDFEGVGGWRDAADPDDDALWMASLTAARLELPRLHHRRTPSSSSLQSMRLSPGLLSPLAVAAAQSYASQATTPSALHRRAATPGWQLKSDGSGGGGGGGGYFGVKHHVAPPAASMASARDYDDDGAGGGGVVVRERGQRQRRRLRRTSAESAKSAGSAGSVASAANGEAAGAEAAAA